MYWEFLIFWRARNSAPLDDRPDTWWTNANSIECYCISPNCISSIHWSGQPMFAGIPADSLCLISLCETSNSHQIQFGQRHWPGDLQLLSTRFLAVFQLLFGFEKFFFQALSISNFANFPLQMFTPWTLYGHHRSHWMWWQGGESCRTIAVSCALSMKDFHESEPISCSTADCL